MNVSIIFLAKTNYYHFIPSNGTFFSLGLEVIWLVCLDYQPFSLFVKKKTKTTSDQNTGFKYYLVTFMGFIVFDRENKAFSL